MAVVNFRMRWAPATCECEIQSSTAYTGHGRRPGGLPVSKMHPFQGIGASRLMASLSLSPHAQACAAPSSASPGPGTARGAGCIYIDSTVHSTEYSVLFLRLCAHHAASPLTSNALDFPHAGVRNRSLRNNVTFSRQVNQAWLVLVSLSFREGWARFLDGKALQPLGQS